MKNFIREYGIIDIFGKLEPITIRIQGPKENNLFVFLSTSEKYPNEDNC